MMVLRTNRTNQGDTMKAQTIRKGHTFQSTLGSVVIERVANNHVWFTCTKDGVTYERDTARWLFVSMYLV